MAAIETGNWNEIPWVKSREGVERAEFAMGADSISCGIGTYSNGHALYPHSHPNEQVSVCVKGRCDYYIDGKPYHMEAGTWITIPADVPHFIYVHDSPEPCMIMDISSPKRPDRAAAYLKALQTNLEAQGGE